MDDFSFVIILASAVLAYSPPFTIVQHVVGFGWPAGFKLLLAGVIRSWYTSVSMGLCLGIVQAK